MSLSSDKTEWRHSNGDWKIAKPTQGDQTMKYAGMMLVLLIASCATSGTSRLQQQFIAIGLSPDRAECLVGELSERLNRKDIKEISGFLDGVNRAQTAGETLDAVLAMDNAAVTKAMASSGVACAFRTIGENSFR